MSLTEICCQASSTNPRKTRDTVTCNRIAITIPLEEKWFCYVEQSLHLYAEQVDFSQALNNMVTASVMEACEELSRAAKEVGIQDDFELILDFKGEAVVVEIRYDGRIPLNPHQTADYEIPDTDVALDSLDLDSLWLHLIKRRMDRVHFSVQGKRHILKLIKYRRDAGKDKQAWVMAITPQLKKGLILHLSDPQAEHPSSVLQAVGKSALKLGPIETFFIRNMDGKISFHDLYMAHIDALGLTSPKALANLYRLLESNSMLRETENAPKPSRLRTLYRQCLNLDLSIPHADALVTMVHAKMRWLYTPYGLALLLITALSGMVPLWQHFARFQTVIGGLEGTVIKHPLILLVLYLMMLVGIMFHELAHGVTCKHYGGRVPRMGIMLYLSSIIFYCDTTASWNFPKKRQRILVSLAGPIMSFAILGLGLWATIYAPAGTLWEAVLVAFCLLNAFALLMNFNPFIKMDAYYMLLDATGVANLRHKSFAFLKNKLLGRLGLGARQITTTRPGEERLFAWYGILGLLVTTVFMALPLIRIIRFLNVRSASGGKLFLAGLLGVLLVMRLSTVAIQQLKTVRCRDYSLQ
jgi:putative peptide zinc metalloprotease protein